MTAIRDLFKARKRAWQGWRSRPNGYALAQAANREFSERAAALQSRLPFRVSVAYAYSPRENVGSKGGDHLICGEAVALGRLKRLAGDALCKPRAKFWGLECLGDGRPASCLRCLEIAEQMTMSVSEVVK